MDDRIQLFNMDCMQLMSEYPDRYFDLAIVDPPYGIGKTWEKSSADSFNKSGKKYTYQNESIPSGRYFQELFRVSKNQIIWGGNYYTDHLSQTNSWIVWDKAHSKTSFMSQAELAWTSLSFPMKLVTLEWDGARKCEKANKVHPHQKPVKLYQWLLDKYATPDQRILDTHLGSASSAIAAHYFGCDFVGCELDTDYFNAACERHQNETAQQAML